MPPIAGITAPGTWVPDDTASTYPVTNPIYGKGGHRSVGTLVERNAIYVPRLEIGMTCYVLATNTTYKLKDTWPGSILSVDADWEVFGGNLTAIGGVDLIPFFDHTDPTILRADTSFRRSIVTEVVTNELGFNVSRNIDANVYISPSGSDTTGTGTIGLPWRNPEKAVLECQLLGPGNYTVNCATGTYSAVNLDIPNYLANGLDTASYKSIIKFEGDQSTPSNVIFTNTSSTLFYHTSKTTVRYHGITFQGNTLNNGTAIVQTDGEIIFRNCQVNNFFALVNAQGPAKVIIEAPVTLSDVYYGVIGYGDVTVLANATVFHVCPNPKVQPPVTFSLTASRLIFGSGATFTLFAIGASVSGHLMNLTDCFVSWGSFNTFRTDTAEGLFTAVNTYFQAGQTNTYRIDGSTNIFKMSSKSIFIDSATSFWGVSSVPTDEILLSTDSIFSSTIILGVGAPPLYSLTDEIINHIKYGADPSYVAYASDNRYTEKYGFHLEGEIPSSYSNANIGPDGITDYPQELYYADKACEIILVGAKTRIANGVLQTDTYKITLNGTPSSYVAAITDDDSAVFSTGVLAVPANTSVSCSFTSAAATTAQDLDFRFIVRLKR
jgi:hypothetical protein